MHSRMKEKCEARVGPFSLSMMEGVLGNARVGEEFESLRRGGLFTPGLSAALSEPDHTN